MKQNFRFEGFPDDYPEEFYRKVRERMAKGVKGSSVKSGDNRLYLVLTEPVVAYPVRGIPKAVGFYPAFKSQGDALAYANKHGYGDVLEIKAPEKEVRL